MKLKLLISTGIGTLMALASCAPAFAADPLTVSCAGTPSATAITWTSSVTGGFAPVALLWGNGATSSSQTVSYGVGSHSITLRATDASSTVATTSCSATIVSTLPVITSFTATPSRISSGQSSVLSWNVSNASSTSISGIGTVASTSITVSPAVTTTYTLSAVNPSGTSTHTAVVTVGTTTSVVPTRIQELLEQIRLLKTQIALLLSGSTTATTTLTLPPFKNYGQWCSTLNHDMKEGDEGEDVAGLQQFLAQDPTIYPEGKVTGKFGKLTREAVKRYQEKNGIAPNGTGFLGPRTRAFLQGRCGEQKVENLYGGYQNGSSTFPGMNRRPDVRSTTSPMWNRRGKEMHRGRGQDTQTGSSTQNDQSETDTNN